MDTQAIRAQMPTLVRGHVPSNIRTFKFNIFDGQPKVSTLGFHIDPKPFEGKVIATTDEPSSSRRDGPSSRCSIAPS
jgi:hypothetical protein